MMSQRLYANIDEGRDNHRSSKIVRAVTNLRHRSSRKQKSSPTSTETQKGPSVSSKVSKHKVPDFRLQHPSARVSIPESLPIMHETRCIRSVPNVVTKVSVPLQPQLQVGPARTSTVATIQDPAALDRPSRGIVEVLTPTELSNNADVGDHVSVTCRRCSTISQNPAHLIDENDISPAASVERFRLPQDVTIVEPSSKTEEYISFLLDQIETFKFTTMVDSRIISDTQDTQAKIDMACRNLLNVHFDVERLCNIWSEIAGAYHLQLNLTSHGDTSTRSILQCSVVTCSMVLNCIVTGLR